jgi:hypothetical protein
MTAKRRAKPTPLDQFAAFADLAGDALRAQLPPGAYPLCPEPEAIDLAAEEFVKAQWPHVASNNTILGNVVAAASRKAKVTPADAATLQKFLHDTLSSIAHNFARAGFLMGMAHMAAWEASLDEPQPRRRKTGRAKAGAR